MKPYLKMNSSNTALLIIDIINSCASEEFEIPEWNIHFSNIRKMVPELKIFIDEYRNKVGGLIVFTNTTPWKREFLTDNINELYTDSAACYYSKDDNGQRNKFYVLQPNKQDIVVTKNHYDAFIGTI